MTEDNSFDIVSSLLEFLSVIRLDKLMYLRDEINKLTEARYEKEYLEDHRKEQK